jgi:hypothetical protein
MLTIAGVQLQWLPKLLVPLGSIPQGTYPEHFQQ